MLSKVDLIAAVGVDDMVGKAAAAFSADPSPPAVLALSCRTKHGVDEFTHLLTALVASKCRAMTSEGPAVAHARHRTHLEICVRYLDAAMVSRSGVSRVRYRAHCSSRRRVRTWS